MAQFNFGSNAGNTAATPNVNFGAKQATPTFGALPSGSITFGTPVASTAQTTGLNFGSSFGTPASGGPSPGFAFSGQIPKTQTGLAFGTPSAAPPLSFGAATPTAATGLTFGSPAPTATGGLPFGTPAAVTTIGLSFGTPTATVTGGLNFGTPATTSAGLSFGTPAYTPVSGLTFGTPASTGGFPVGGGTTATTTSTLFGGLGVTATTPSVLGSTNTGFSLGGGLGGTSPGLKPVSGTTNLPFGTPATAITTTASTGFSLGLGTSTATSQPLQFNFGATQQPQATLSLGSSITQNTSIGLGGVDTTLLKTGTTTTGRVDTIAAKENSVPNEILQNIENFKTFVKDQKAHSSDVSRGSARPFLKVGQDIDLLMNTLSEVGNELQKNQQIANKLKHDSAKCLQNAEMAQRTNDTPPGLQFENNAPLHYFIEIVNKFEQDIQALRMQIDVTDKHIQSLNETKFLTSQELSLGMRRLHDTFVALAGRLQSVHQQVESQREQYLNLRKYILKDPTDVFAKPVKDISKQIENREISFHNVPSIPGPTPFSTLGAPNSGMMMMMAPQEVPNKPPPAYPTGGSTSLNFGTPTTTPLATNPTAGNTSIFSGTGTLFSGMGQLGQIPTSESSGFQLQNPPLGNKRGKR